MRRLNENSAPSLLGNLTPELYRHIISYCNRNTLMTLRRLDHHHNQAAENDFLHLLTSLNLQRSKSRTHELYLTAAGNVWTREASPTGELSITTNKEIKNIDQIGAGIGFNAALNFSGDVWVWRTGQHPGFKGLEPVPRKAPYLKNIERLFVGHHIILAKDHQGCVWAWGDEDYAEHIGLQPKSLLGSTLRKTDHTTPKVISGLENIVDVVFSEDYFLAVKEDGSVWAVGEFGPTNIKYLRPVDGLKDILKIYIDPTNLSQNAFAFAITKDRKVLSIGYEFFGQLAIGVQRRTFSTPREVKGMANVAELIVNESAAYARTEQGTLYEVVPDLEAIDGINYYKAIQVKGLEKVKAVSTFYQVGYTSEFFARSQDGTLWQVSTDHIHQAKKLDDATRKHAIVQGLVLDGKTRDLSTILEMRRPQPMSTDHRHSLIKDLQHILKPTRRTYGLFSSLLQPAQAELVEALLQFISIKTSYTAIREQIHTVLEVNRFKLSPDQDRLDLFLRRLLTKLDHFDVLQINEKLSGLNQLS